MIELSLEYLNQLAKQSIFISALLCGFSLTVLVLLLENNSKGRVYSAMFTSATVSTYAFIIGIFAMTRILMVTTPGYPFEVNEGDLMLPRLLGALMFYVGITSVIIVVSLSGWIKSKRIGIFSTLLGIITFVIVTMMTS